MSSYDAVTILIAGKSLSVTPINSPNLSPNPSLITDSDNNKYPFTYSEISLKASLAF